MPSLLRFRVGQALDPLPHGGRGNNKENLTGNPRKDTKWAMDDWWVSPTLPVRWIWNIAECASLGLRGRSATIAPFKDGGSGKQKAKGYGGLAFPAALENEEQDDDDNQDDDDFGRSYAHAIVTSLTLCLIHYIA